MRSSSSLPKAAVDSAMVTIGRMAATSIPSSKTLMKFSSKDSSSLAAKKTMTASPTGSAASKNMSPSRQRPVN